MVESQERVEFEDSGSLSSEELNYLESLKEGESSLDNFDEKDLKDLREQLLEEKEAYLNRSQNEASKQWIGSLIDSVVFSIDSRVDNSNTGNTESSETDQGAEQNPGETNQGKERIERGEKFENEVDEFLNKENLALVQVEDQYFFLDTNSEAFQEHTDDNMERFKSMVNQDAEGVYSLEEVMEKSQDKIGVEKYMDLNEDQKLQIIDGLYSGDIVKDFGLGNIGEFRENLKKTDVTNATIDLPKEGFDKGVYEKETFDKGLLNEINISIQDLTIETDKGEQNVAKILDGNSITYKNGEVEIGSVSLGGEAKDKLSQEISSVMEEYGLDSNNIEVSFDIKDGWFGGKNLDAFDVRSEETDNMFDLLKIESTVNINPENGIIDGLPENIEEDKFYRVEKGDEEKVLKGDKLKDFLEGNDEYVQKQIDNDERDLDVDKAMAKAQEIGLEEKYLPEGYDFGHLKIDDDSLSLDRGLGQSDNIHIESSGDNEVDLKPEGGFNGVEGVSVDNLGEKLQELENFMSAVEKSENKVEKIDNEEQEKREKGEELDDKQKVMRESLNTWLEGLKEDDKYDIENYNEEAEARYEDIMNGVDYYEQKHDKEDSKDIFENYSEKVGIEDMSKEVGLDAGDIENMYSLDLIGWGDKSYLVEKTDGRFVGYTEVEGQTHYIEDNSKEDVISKLSVVRELGDENAVNNYLRKEENEK